MSEVVSRTFLERMSKDAVKVIACLGCTSVVIAYLVYVEFRISTSDFVFLLAFLVGILVVASHPDAVDGIREGFQGVSGDEIGRAVRDAILPRLDTLVRDTIKQNSDGTEAKAKAKAKAKGDGVDVDEDEDVDIDLAWFGQDAVGSSRLLHEYRRIGSMWCQLGLYAPNERDALNSALKRVLSYSPATQFRNT